MSLNYAFGFSFILLLLVIVNFYFFYILTSYRSSASHFINVTPLDTDPHIKEIDKYLHYLAHQFRSKNAKFSVVQHEIINSFNSSSKKINLKNVWHNTEMVSLVTKIVISFIILARSLYLFLIMITVGRYIIPLSQQRWCAWTNTSSYAIVQDSLCRQCSQRHSIETFTIN